MIENFSRNIPAIVISAEATEDELIRIIRDASVQGNWMIGESASKWLSMYSKGRSDQSLSDATGVSSETIAQCRRVWERFEATKKQFPHLRWTFFREALAWDDAHECLKWANECEATVAEMKAWRRAQRGEDLFAEDGQELPEINAVYSKDTGETRSKQQSTKPEGRTIHRSVESRPSPPPKPPSKATEPPSEAAVPVDPTTTVQMTLRKIGHMIAFVVDNGSPLERVELLRKLVPIVESLSKGGEP